VSQSHVIIELNWSREKQMVSRTIQSTYKASELNNQQDMAVSLDGAIAAI
jgi:hypothetical protein